MGRMTNPVGKEKHRQVRIQPSIRTLRSYMNRSRNIMVSTMAKTQRKKSSSKKKAVCLPDEITEEILSWLPAKPLFRFKSVSKPWCKLISDSRFARKHLTRGSKLKIMFRIDSQYGKSISESGKSIQGLKYATLDYDSVGEDVEIPDETFVHISRVYNSYHGVFLVSSSLFNDSICICNPTTGQRRVLPRQFTVDPNFVDIYGIGYDFTIKEYKVLGLREHRYNPIGIDWGMYKQCTKSWQKLNNNKYMSVYSSEMKFLENALHILVSCLKSGSYDPELILAFDLSREEFREIALPNHGDRDFGIDMETSHSCLCLVSHLNGSAPNVWVMMEYGNHDSWTKRYSINLEVFPEIPEILHLSESGDILAWIEDMYRDSDKRLLIVYDSKKNKWKTLKSTISGLILTDTNIYVESLVTFDIGDIPRMESKGRKRGNRKERCFQIVKSSALCDFDMLSNSNLWLNSSSPT